MADRSYPYEGSHDNSNIIWRHWNSLTTILGLLCAAGLWGMAVTTISDHKAMGIYLIFCGTIVTFLEISFTIEKIFGCCSPESRTRRCWLLVLALDHWKRGLLYIILSIACYVHPNKIWQVIVAGVILDFSGLLYFVKTVKHYKKPEPYKYKQLSIG